jgi:hypothetical protein
MSSVISSTIGLLGIYPYYKLTDLFFGVMLFRDGDPNGLPFESFMMNGVSGKTILFTVI